MIEFTFWDILRNLLLATRWTVVLSLVAFVGGGSSACVLLFARVSKSRAAGARRLGLHRVLPGHAAADAAVPGLLRPRAARPRRVAVAAAGAGAHALDQRLPRRDLARLRRGIPKGQWEARQPGAELSASRCAT